MNKLAKEINQYQLPHLLELQFGEQLIAKPRSLSSNHCIIVRPDDELILPPHAPAIAKAAPKCKYLIPLFEFPGVSHNAITTNTSVDDHSPKIRTVLSPNLSVMIPPYYFRSCNTKSH